MNKKDRINAEVLAPAGSAQALLAGVRCGADAVYLGTKAFNARRGADNFDGDELEKAVALCHARGVKLHVTLNTLVRDDELDAAMKEAEHVCACGADVLILQDLGLAYLIGMSAPGMLRHASTQMSVQTSAGVRLLEKLGYDRVVLARELSKEEIADITENSNIETECFVHGALCMCVSGQCYMSSVLGSRSGNRGMCAQPCRLPFSAPGGTGFDLSLKDNSLVDRLPEMSGLGVDSFKIEGRMKRPEYVAAAVTACRRKLDGGDTADMMNNLKAVFSRTGFTSGYYDAALGRDMFGTRRKEDVTSAAGVLSKLQNLYRKERQCVAVSFMLSAVQGESVTLAARANGINVFDDSGELPQTAENKPSTVEGLTQHLQKCGGTVFFADSVEVELDDDLFIPASLVNNLRRRVLELLQDKIECVKEADFTHIDFDVPEHSAKSRKVYAFFADAKEIPENIDKLDTIYVPFETEIDIIKKLMSSGVRTGVALPRGLFGREQYVSKRLGQLYCEGIRLAYCQNLDAVELASEAGMTIHTGFGLNVFNSATVKVLEKLGASEATLSFELTLRQAQRVGGSLPRGIIAYGRLPLMLTRNCPLKNGRTCAQCDKKGSLTDRLGVSFPVRCGGGCSEVLNSRPLWLADRLNEIVNMDFITLYFTTESASQAAQVIDAYTGGANEKAPGEFTRGLYYRAVL